MALKTLFERRAQQTVTQATPEQQPGLPENALKNNEVTRATPVTQSFEISEADAGSSPAGPEKGVARPLLCRVTGVTWVTTLKDKEKSGNPAVTQAGTWVTGSAQRQPAPVSAGSLAARLAAAGATVRVWDGGDQSHVELPPPTGPPAPHAQPVPSYAMAGPIP